jgi:ABC-type sugar transport system ATPase subunit
MEGIPGEVDIVEPLGCNHMIGVQISDVCVHVLVDTTLAPKIVDKVKLSFDVTRVHFFKLKMEQSLLWH